MQQSESATCILLTVYCHKPQSTQPLSGVGSKQNSSECREGETGEQNQGSGEEGGREGEEYVMGRRISRACRGFVASKLQILS